MSLQSASKVLAAIKVETTAGVAATASGATQLRIINSPGLKLSRAIIQSEEKKSNSLKGDTRLGYKSVGGSFNGELSVGGGTDIAQEGINRTSYASAVAIGFATMTTVAIGTNEVVAAGGSWISQGVRVGDIFTISGSSVSADNGLNTRVLALTTLTISVATGTFATLSAASTGTLTILKKLKSPTTATARSYTVEQVDQDADGSEVFTGCQFVGVDYSFKPGQMATQQFTMVGIDETTYTGGSSPYFTSPTLTTSLQLVADDSTIRYNGSTVTTFTGMDISFRVTAAGVPVIGSTTTPQIFDNDLMIEGTVTGLRSDFSSLTLFNAETEFEMSILLQEPTGSPKACFSLYFPRVKLVDVEAPFGGGDGAKTETKKFVVMDKTATTTADGGYLTVHSSAA